MRNWINAAQMLRDVRMAREQFALRHEIDQAIIGPMFLDRLAHDLGEKVSPLPFANLHRRRLKDDEG